MKNTRTLRRLLCDNLSEREKIREGKIQIPYLIVTVKIIFKYILIKTVFQEKHWLLFAQHIYHK